MKTGKIFKMLLLLVLLAVAAPSVSVASTTTPIAMSSPEEQVARLQNRLDEINAMDKKSLTREQKKALRVEVRTIKKEMAAVSGGVYLSIGAIIIIALLLILLL
jgi:hypothetical protein